MSPQPHRPDAANLTDQQRRDIRRYLVWEQGVLAIPINLAINAAIAFLLNRHLEAVPLNGSQSIASDVHGTCLLMPFIANAIITAITRQRLRRGVLPHVPRRIFTAPAWGDAFSRGFVLAIVFWVLFAPLTLWTLKTLDVTSWSLGQFLVFKSLFAAGLGIFICPLCAWLALGDDVSPAVEN